MGQIGDLTNNERRARSVRLSMVVALPAFDLLQADERLRLDAGQADGRPSPGLQDRKTSGLPRSTTTGRAHRPPRSETLAIKPRKSGSPRKGQ
jgi:hypothetical protein